MNVIAKITSKLSEASKKVVQKFVETFAKENPDVSYRGKMVIETKEGNLVGRYSKSVAAITFEQTGTVKAVKDETKKVPAGKDEKPAFVKLSAAIDAGEVEKKGSWLKFDGYATRNKEAFVAKYPQFKD